ncbi:hypothetical protein CASFOL_003410 [Castilleja foliolosa]|uniref:Uncharacterized protein n=1 Tax=Castilleja foliolosa TaxID=1961234 RepID=A0ABD3EHJ7_9LAMI
MPKKPSSSRVSRKNKTPKIGSNGIRKPKNRKVNSMAEKDCEVIDVDSYSSPDIKSTPLRAVYCLKNRDQIKDAEGQEECFILDFDPYDDSSEKSKFLLRECLDNGDADLHVVAERGQMGTSYMGPVYRTSQPDNEKIHISESIIWAKPIKKIPTQQQRINANNRLSVFFTPRGTNQDSDLRKPKPSIILHHQFFEKKGISLCCMPPSHVNCFKIATCKLRALHRASPLQIISVSASTIPEACSLQLKATRKVTQIPKFRLTCRIGIWSFCRASGFPKIP